MNDTGCAGFFLAIFAMGAFIVAIQAWRAARRAEQHAETLQVDLDYVRRVLADLRRDTTPAGTEARTEAAPVGSPSEPAAAAPAEPGLKPSLAKTPTAAPSPAAARLPEIHPYRTPAPTSPPSATESATLQTSGVASTAFPKPQPSHVPAPQAPAPPPRPPQPPPPPPPTAPPTPDRPRFDWENLVGVKLFSWIAGTALVLAAIFFLRYSVEQGWLNPTVRATIGLLTGISLLVVCELRVARDYKFTANALHGAGIAILYATLFATHALWHLLPAPVVFGLMLLVTAVAVMLSIRRDSIFIALLGLVGGFATPALLSTGDNRPIALFSYLLLLNAGLAWVAYRKRWPALTALSVALTILYQWAWIARFMTPAQFPMAAGIFTVFAISAAISFWIRHDEDEAQTIFERTAAAGAVLPLLFAVYTSVVPAYGARVNILFGYLLLMNVGLSFIAWNRKREWLHELGALSAVIVFGLWFLQSWNAHAWPAILGWIAAFVVLYLVVATGLSSYARYAAPALFFTFVALIAIGATGGAAALLFGTLFILLAAISALAIWRDDGLLYYGAAFFTIAAEAAWSAKYLEPQRLITGLSLYGIFALFFLGVPLLARRFGRRLAPRNAATVLVLFSLAMLLFLTSHRIADAALWGSAILLAIINVGALFEARTTANPALSGLAMLLSWIVLGVWWSSATLTIAVVPALIVVCGFALLITAGSLWAAAGSEQRDEFASGTYLALIGHLFLLFVAAQPSLALPPWPMFAVLAVLDLAAGVAALYLERPRLMTAALVASQTLLVLWTSQARATPWPNVALIAALIIAALGLTWFAIDRRHAESAAAALVGGYVVAIVAGTSSATPLFWSLLATHVLITVAVLAVAWISEWQVLALIASLMTAFGTEMARTASPGQSFAFGAVLYALIVAYPLVLGGRARKGIEPHLAAVLASGWFFFVGRAAMRQAHLGFMIGVLPVGEALVLLVVLWRLLTVERPDERVLSRLALVAGAALAFITAAIPLQLEKQWITIAWALEGAALVWLFRKIPHRGLLAWAGALLAAVFVRLTLNPAVLTYHPLGNHAILNWYLYTYVVAAAAMFVAAWYARGVQRSADAVLNSAGAILLFLVLNIEIADFYSHGRTLTFNFFSSSLAQDLTYTIGWAIFAIAMLIAGIVFASRATRIAATALFLVTILKCFLHDLARLGGLYRVASLLGLAASLVVVAVLLQRFVMLKPKEETS